MTDLYHQMLSTIIPLLPYLIVVLVIILIPIIVTVVFFPKNTKLIHFDAYLVLGAAPTKEGSISRMMMSRVDEVVGQYYFRKRPIIFSGGTPYSKVSEAKIMAQYALERGVDAKHIILEEQANNTFENFKYSIPLMKKHNLQNICIITNSFHIRRVCFFASKFKLSFMCIPVPLTSYFSFSYILMIYIVESLLRIKCLFYEVKKTSKTTKKTN